MAKSEKDTRERVTITIPNEKEPVVRDPAVKKPSSNEAKGGKSYTFHGTSTIRTSATPLKRH
jgi:hypothetical protein